MTIQPGEGHGLPPRVRQTIILARTQGYHVQVKRQERYGPYVVIKQSDDEYTGYSIVLYVDRTGRRVTPTYFTPLGDRRLTLSTVRHMLRMNTL
ncbi:hypothetical protein AB0L64_36280 [Kribbella sp. NPDC051936]|uniref:hypothetical protein n=1 Tax=Kribbella sp. NPDC051936 TaxID=3154946 RepID=UPI00343719BC